MKFRTEYLPKQVNNLLDPESTIVLLGSCFTNNIGERMRNCRWRAFPNMFGPLYNPFSIARILRIAFDRNSILDVIEGSLVKKDNLWVSWLTGSACSTYSREETFNRLYDKFSFLYNKLQEAGTLIITFGTSWVYELKERPGYIVSNCHKFPADIFERRRLSVSEIFNEWNEILRMLSERFPDLRVILTISPVRHLKDGMEGNSRSKAILQLACEDLCKHNENVEYFPSYEVMMDDLRDYRFYTSDMIHPSETAVDYIWEKFQERYLSERSRKLLAEGEKVTRRLNHRPILHGNSETAKYMASPQELEVAKQYNAFMEAHPKMLSLDE